MSVSGEPPTKLFAPAIRAAGNSGWPPSIPESITATLTVASFGKTGQKSQARSLLRYHCFGSSGSFVAKASRRDRSSRST